MKNNQIWVVVGVSLAVAIIASLITVSITGNVIVRQGFGSQVNVATKAEVLDMLNKCEMFSLDSVCRNGVCSNDSIFGRIPIQNGTTDASSICKKIQKTCVSAFTKDIDTGDLDELASCNLRIYPDYLRFTCCSS